MWNPGKLHSSLLMLVLMCAGTLYLCALCPDAVGLYHDDGIYIVTAKALATGQGYKIISLPRPVPQTKYPIAYPFILSIIWRVFPSFPENLIPMKLLSIIAALLFFIWVYRYLTKFDLISKNYALVIIALAALCPITLYFSSMVMSEMLYALLSILSIYVLERSAREDGSTWALGLSLALLVAIAILTRTIGISLLVAAFLYLLYQRRFSKAALFLIAVLLIVGPWFVWTGLISRYFEPSKIEVYYVSYSRWLFDNMTSSDLSKLLYVPVKNLIYLVAEIALQLNPLISRQMGWIKDATFSPILSIAFLVALFFGLVVVFRAAARKGYRFTALDFYVAAYVIFLLMWPWPPWRFMVVILPFVFFYVIKGAALVNSCFCFLSPERRRLATRMAMIIFLSSSFILNVALDIGMVRDTLRYGWNVPPPTPNPGPAWADIRDIYKQINLNTPPHANLASIHDLMCYLYSDRRAITFFELGPVQSFYTPYRETAADASGAGEIINNLKTNNIQFLVSFPGFELGALGLSLNLVKSKYPELLSLTYNTPTGNMKIYKVNLSAITQ